MTPGRESVARDNGPSRLDRPPQAVLQGAARARGSSRPDRPLEQEQSTLHAIINSADFYKEDATAIAAALDRVRDVDTALLDALARWDELESRSDRK